MLAVSRAPLLTPRLELRRTQVEDAAALFGALRDPAIYAFIPREAPASAADLERRFARITQETAPERAEQWLNWTVWLRHAGAPIGMTEATVTAAGRISIGYMFDPAIWRRGYGREAVLAMIDHLASAGGEEFEASIDPRNEGSLALARALGFMHAGQDNGDEILRLRR